MKVVHTSDTHNKYPELPECELLIHSGDITDSGTIDELMNGLLWLQSQKAKMKIFVPGNHDMCLDEHHMYGMSPASIEALVNTQKKDHNIHILLDSQVDYKPEGWSRTIVIGGTSIQPWFGGWGFNSTDVWARKNILEYTAAVSNIMVTHAPPKHILDINRQGESCGDQVLTQVLKEPHTAKYLFVGHIHDQPGHTYMFDTEIYNSATIIQTVEIEESDFI